jgi:hypothetical protein
MLDLCLASTNEAHRAFDRRAICPVLGNEFSVHEFRRHAINMRDVEDG